MKQNENYEVKKRADWLAKPWVRARIIANIELSRRCMDILQQSVMPAEALARTRKEEKGRQAHFPVGCAVLYHIERGSARPAAAPLGLLGPCRHTVCARSHTSPRRTPPQSLPQKDVCQPKWAIYFTMRSLGDDSIIKTVGPFFP